jgi:hypothetical protein
LAGACSQTARTDAIGFDELVGRVAQTFGRLGLDVVEAAHPAHTSRRISGDQGSPITSKVRAMEHAISPKRVRRMAAIQQVGFPYGT